MRITLPEGEQPVVFVALKMGSSRLLRSRAESYDAMLHNDSDITPAERELIRMRVVLETDCNLCASVRFADEPGYSSQEIPDELYEHVPDYKTWHGYTERDRLVIEFAERYMLDYQDMSRDDRFWGRLGAEFTEAEIADLCMLTSHWDGMRKELHLLLGIDEMCTIPVGGQSLGDIRAQQAGSLAAP